MDVGPVGLERICAIVDTYLINLSANIFPLLIITSVAWPREGLFITIQWAAARHACHAKKGALLLVRTPASGKVSCWIVSYGSMYEP